MYGNFRDTLQNELKEITASGLYKSERRIASAQQARIKVGEKQVLNMCANNYLGLADNDEIIAAVKKGLDERGFGMASVRFICGTQDIHHNLEKKISEFFGTDDTILYSSCFDANTGLFETLLGEKDAIVSDALNHASIIDGIRLCKAARYRYDHGDMAALEKCLQASAAAQTRMIATDGVFSMDGEYAKLDQICDLAEAYEALVMVDDSHATGFVGPTGRGTVELYGVQQRVDIITSTLGKALGGASGGFTTGRRDIIEILRQRSRPYLFSNSLAPPIVSAALKTIDLLEESQAPRERLESNTRFFREKIAGAGFTIKSGRHPIVPIMLGDARLAQDMAARLLDEGVYAIGFFYPVVPKNQARIRVQISAAHTREDLAFALEKFIKVGKELKVID
ncbi:MAG: glycine C-acetyltransferase [Deltaproteobacteria bacterium]|jgi:glycine C-acetyltransferase|nr:glycine C-acetyltransferase [Deltaproteobacteria bacterium]MBW2478854.1 glycine C-acetyltransferase [Deltaproteobacteria bacterium]